MPRSKAAEEHHKKMIAIHVYEIDKCSNSHDEDQRNSASQSPRPGYQTDPEEICSDSTDSDSSGSSSKHHHVHVKPGSLNITTRSDDDLRNVLKRDRDDTRHPERFVEVISEAVEVKIHENPDSQSRDNRRGRRDRTPTRNSRRRSPSPKRCRPLSLRQQYEKKKLHSKTESPPVPPPMLKSEAVILRMVTHGRAASKREDPPPAAQKQSDEMALNYEMSHDDENINNVSTRRQLPRTWDDNISVNGKLLKMKIDSGSTINTLSIRKFKQLGLREEILRPTNTTIQTYSDTTMQPLGEFKVTLALRGRRSKAKFLLLDEEVPALLGMPMGAALGLFHFTNQSVMQWCDSEDEECWEFKGIDAVEDEFL